MSKGAYNMLTIRLESTRLVLLEVNPSQREVNGGPQGT